MFLKFDLLIYFTIVLIFLSLLIPKFSVIFAWGWLSLSSLLGEIILKLILIITFILFVIPVGLIRRIMGKDTLGLKKWQQEKTSNFKSRNYLYSANDLKHPY